MQKSLGSGRVPAVSKPDVDSRFGSARFEPQKPELKKWKTRVANYFRNSKPCDKLVIPPMLKHRQGVREWVYEMCDPLDDLRRRVERGEYTYGVQNAQQLNERLAIIQIEANRIAPPGSPKFSIMREVVEQMKGMESICSEVGVQIGQYTYSLEEYYQAKAREFVEENREQLLKIFRRLRIDTLFRTFVVAPLALFLAPVPIIMGGIPGICYARSGFSSEFRDMVYGKTRSKRYENAKEILDIVLSEQRIMIGLAMMISIFLYVNGGMRNIAIHLLPKLPSEVTVFKMTEKRGYKIKVFGKEIDLSVDVSVHRRIFMPMLMKEDIDLMKKNNIDLLDILNGNMDYEEQQRVLERLDELKEKGN